MTSPKKQVSSSEWKVGDKVTHKAWGEGMVSNVNEKNGSVELISYLNLKDLNVYLLNLRQ